MTAFTIEAASISRVSREGRLNRYNLYADSLLLESGNRGLHRAVCQQKKAEGVAVYSLVAGLGTTEEAGSAAELAGTRMKDKLRELEDYLLTPRARLERCHEYMNRGLRESGLAAEVVTALLTPEEIYICNVGSTRAYRLRGVELQQLSRDNQGRLGSTAVELTEQRYLARGEMKSEDVYILCNREFAENINKLRFFELQQRDKSIKTSAEELVNQLPESDSALLLLRICRE